MSPTHGDAAVPIGYALFLNRYAYLPNGYRSVPIDIIQLPIWIALVVVASKKKRPSQSIFWN
jgi:hypothetical protein